MFVLTYIYLLVVFCNSFTFDILFDFISADLQFNGVLYISLKNIFDRQYFFKLIISKDNGCSEDVNSGID